MLVWNISDFPLLSVLKIKTNPLFFQDILVIRAFPREDDLSAALSAPTDAALFSRDTRAQIFPSERSVSTQKSHFINYNQALRIDIFFPLFGWDLARAALQHLEDAKKEQRDFCFSCLSSTTENKAKPLDASPKKKETARFKSWIKLFTSSQMTRPSSDTRCLTRCSNSKQVAVTLMRSVLW